MPDCSNCTTDLCVVRNRKLPASQLTTCRNGNAAAVDTLLAMIEQGRKHRREARKEKPFTKETQRRVAAPSAPSTLGTRIRAALESTGHYLHAPGDLRRFLVSLDRVHQLGFDEIGGTVFEALMNRPINTHVAKQPQVDVGTISGIVARAMAEEAAANPQPVKPTTQPDVSTLGTQILATLAVEFTEHDDAPYRFSCSTCVSYLMSLNQTTDHDVDVIVAKLLVSLQLPDWKRKEVGNIKAQRIWLRAIVDLVVTESIVTAEPLQ